jgi:hypothetical protein
MRRWCNKIIDGSAQYAVLRLLYPLFDRQSSLPLTTAALLISGTNTLAKLGTADFYAFASGSMVKVANGTNMAALVGTVAHGTFNVFCFFVDAAGNLTSAMGTAGATLSKVVFPQFPDGKALVGFIIINPTGTGAFVGGTTGLADVTVIPNTVYISPNGGGFDPACITGLVATP